MQLFRSLTHESTSPKQTGANSQHNQLLYPRIQVSQPAVLVMNQGMYMPALLAGLKISAISLFGPLIQVQGCIAAVPGWRRKSRFRLQHFVRQVGFSAMSTNSEWTRASWRHGGQLLLPLQRARRWFDLIWLGADCTLHILL